MQQNNAAQTVIFCVSLGSTRMLNYPNHTAYVRQRYCCKQTSPPQLSRKLEKWIQSGIAQKRWIFIDWSGRGDLPDWKMVWRHSNAVTVGWQRHLLVPLWKTGRVWEHGDRRAAAAAAAAAAKSRQSCPTLCDPIEGSPPGSPVPGIL